MVSGSDNGSRLVGPSEDRDLPLEPMQYALEHTREVAGVGTLFRDETGIPLLHMHMACGRAGATLTGCIRIGVKVWHLMEIILQELVDTAARRTTEQPLGLKLLKQLVLCGFHTTPHGGRQPCLASMDFATGTDRNPQREKTWICLSNLA